jgi:hypothetical protein
MASLKQSLKGYAVAVAAAEQGKDFENFNYVMSAGSADSRPAQSRFPASSDFMLQARRPPPPDSLSCARRPVPGRARR